MWLPLDVFTNWLLLVSLTVAIGIVVTRWLVLPSVAAPGHTSTSDWHHDLARSGGWMAAMLAGSLLLVFARQLIEFRDPFVSWTVDARLLLNGTQWGVTWWTAMGLTVTAIGAFRWARSSTRWGWLAAGLSVLALGAFPALTGHANSGDLRAITIAADILHVWAAGAWIGTLGVMLFLEWRERRRPQAERVGVLSILVPRFSPVAMASVAVLTMTGAFGGWVHVAGWSDLLTTGYGRLLTVKVLIVIIVLGLGAWNWRRLSPMLGEERGREALRTSASVEFVVANVVLAITAALIRTSPM